MDMNLRLLRYFLAVASSLSFSRAAENLHVAQSTLSQQIQQLEESYGVRLFDRTGRSIALTPAGLVLQESASQLLNEHDQLRSQLQAVDQGCTQEVQRLHIFFDIHMTRDEHMVDDLVGAIQDLQAEISPHIAVAVRLQAQDLDTPNADLDEVLSNNQIDFWLFGREEPLQRSELMLETIYSDQFAVSISENHPLYRPDLTTNDLPELLNRTTLFLLQNRSRYVSAVLNSISDNVSPALRFETSADVVSLYVALGLGVSVVPYRTNGAIPTTNIHFIGLPNTHFYTLAGYARGNDNPLLPILLQKLKNRVRAHG